MAKCEGHIHRVKHDGRVKPERNATVYVLYQEGMRLKEIARQFNIAPCTAANIIRNERERNTP